MDKKLIWIFWICFFIGLTLPIVSAGLYKDVSNGNANIIVKDKVWIDVFGWFADDVAELELITPINYLVPVGYQEVAEFKINSVQELKFIISEMDVYDRKDGMKEVSTDLDYKIKVIEKTPVYDLVVDSCKEVKQINGTYQSCSYKQEIVDYQEIEEWINLSEYNFKNNEEITVGIFTEVEKGESKEWIATFDFNGEKVRFEEWASWTTADCETGGTVTLDGDFCVHTFLTNDTFTTTKDLENVSYLVVAGGGAGGGSHGGGGGAGGLIYETNQTLSADSYTVVVGLGGNAVLGTEVGVVHNGTNSSFNGDNALGGGGGGRRDNTGVTTRGQDGGSGGGGAGTSPETAGSELVSQGNDGGAGSVVGIAGNGGGGGGASAVGQTASGGDGTGYSGSGGAGLSYSISGSSVCYAGGGGGGRWEAGSVGSATCGGGGGSADDGVPATNGTGGGGGGKGSGGTISGSGGSGIVIIRYELIGLQFEDQSPSNNTNISTSNVGFGINVSDPSSVGVKNVSLKIDDVVNQTNSSGVEGVYNWSVDVEDGDHNFSIIAYDNNNQSYVGDVYYFIIDTTSPVLSATDNLTDLLTLTLPVDSVWSFNATDLHIAQCYYNTSDNSTYTIETCNSSITTSWATEGAKTIQFCANDTFGFETCDTATIDVYYIQETQTDNPDPIAEGSDAVFTFTLNLTSIPTTTANLILNNTVYSPTTTTAGSDGYYFEITVNIPDSWGNTTGNVVDWFWNYTIDGVITNQSTATTNITVYELAIDDCGSYGEVILNLSLKDEETNTLFNESSNDTANVEIDLTLTSKDNSSVYVEYHNTWTDENNPQVCIPINILNDTDYWIDFTIGFDSTDHVWEFYYLDDGTLNSSKQFDAQTNYSIDLMDLLTTDSTSFLFNYFDQDGLPVDDAIVHVFRKYIGDGEFYEVERSKADQNGDTIVHVVEEDVIYYFLISQYGVPLYTSSNYNALCQTTPCEIQIEASGGFSEFQTDYDLIDGGAVAVTSNSSTREVTLTYALNESADMNFTVFKYNSDGSYSSVVSNTSTGSTGSITLSVPMSAGNVSFFTTITKDDQFIKSEWVDFEAKATDRFGLTLSLFIGALIILTLGLVAVTEGAGTIVMVILGIFLSGALGLITTKLSTGVNVLIYLILAGGLILWKITSGRRG